MENFQKIYNQGFALYKQGLVKKALPYFEKVIQLKSDYMFAHYLKGLSHIRLKDWENVIITFKNVIELAPKEGDAYFNIGTAHYELKQYKESIKFIEKSIVIGLQDNPLSQAYYNLGLAHKDKAILTESKNFLGKWDSPLKAFKQCIKLNPNHAAAHFQLGTILLTTDCHYDAIKYFKSNISFDPNYKQAISIESLIGIATCYCALDNFSETLSYLKIAIDKEPRIKGVAKVDPGFKKIRQSFYEKDFMILTGK